MLIPKKQTLPSRLNAKERPWRPTWMYIAKPYFKKIFFIFYKNHY